MKGDFLRVEVLTGLGRRWHWSASEKAQAIAETFAPGASVSEVARRWHVCPQKVFTWRRKARAGSLALPGEAMDLMQASFVPIVPDVPDGAPSSGPPNVMPPVARLGKVTAAPGSEIKPAEAVLRVTGDTDTVLLADVLRAVRVSAT